MIGVTAMERVMALREDPDKKTAQQIDGQRAVRKTGAQPLDESGADDIPAECADSAAGYHRETHAPVYHCGGLRAQ